MSKLNTEEYFKNKRSEVMPQKINREYRSLALIEETEDYIIEGYATTFERYELYEYDGIKYYEEIDRNAFDGADFSDVIMQYDHNGKVFARTSNGTLQLSIDDKGLRVRADLSKSQSAKELYEEIKNGLITKMSWAFSVGEESYSKETRTRKFLKVKKIYDVSAVSIPANQDTSINARSFFDGVIEEERKEFARAKAKRLRLLLDVEGD